MKLIIDIPEEQYRTLNAKTQEEVVAVIDDKVIITAVENGTPLSESGDCISRQAVIDLPRIKTHNQWGNVIKESVDIEDVRQLPPVTPAEKQEPREDVSDINDGNIYECPCGYGWDKSKVVRHHFCPNCGRAVDSTELEPCTDAISRQAVIDMTGLSEWFDSSDNYNKFVFALSELPPVIPQYTEAEIQRMQELEQAEIQKAYELGKADAEKVGQWIDIQYFKSDDTYYRPKCPFCNTEPKEYSNYCPNCGAKMQEVME